MSRRPHTTICREGWYYLLVTAIVFIGAMVKEVNLLLLLSGMMMGLLLFHWQVLFVSLSGMKLERKAPQAVCAGDLLAVSLQLSNTRSHFGSWAVAVEEQIEREPGPPGLNHGYNYQHRHNHDKPITTGVLFPYIPAGAERTGTYRGRLAQRGRYRLGPMRISTRFPFGLFSRKFTVGQSETIYVYPRLGRLTRRWLARHRQALAGADRRQRRPGPEGDFYGVREWRSGDSLRLMHWRSSARTGKFVVRQFEQPHNRDAAILLDLWLPERPSDAQLDNVELAISFAATVLADLGRQGGGKVHLGVFDGKPLCLGGPASAALLQDMMKTLAVLAAQSQDRLPELIEHVLGEIASGTEIVLISTRPVDLTDGKRFAAVCSNPALHVAARRVRCIDASSDELEEFFITE
ncbi:MAG: DUF58 domain-containing protein [Thermoguttaceae bacterium]|jgi:uncharacterized protein (DUF58 family)